MNLKIEAFLLNIIFYCHFIEFRMLSLIDENSKNRIVFDVTFVFTGQSKFIVIYFLFYFILFNAADFVNAAC